MNIDITKIKRIIKKLSKKNPVLSQALKRKILQLAELDQTGIEHLKNLKGELSHLKRVHINSFVLTFQLRDNTIIFESFTHHDKAY